MKQVNANSDNFQKMVLNKFEELHKEMNEIREQQKDYHNQNMNKHDKTMQIIETLRDENTIGAYQTRELREDVEKLKSIIPIKRN